MATTITKHETLVGKRIRRKEDPRLITGTATYVDDIQMPGMHHACILRSPHAAAKIRSLECRSRAPASRRGRSLHRRRCQRRRPGALRRIAARPARSGAHHSGRRPRLFRRTSGGRRGRHRPLHRRRRRGPDRSGLRADAGRGRSGESARSRARPPCIPSGPITSPSTITRKAAIPPRLSPRRRWW